MNASEWIKSLSKIVKEDSSSTRKTCTRLGSSLVSLSKDYYLLLCSQNVCYLLEHKQDTVPVAIQVHWSITLSFEASAIRLHPHGNFGALVGERGVACFSYDVSSLKWKISNRRQVVIDVVEIGRSRSHSGLFDLRADLTVVDLCWHPSSTTHLCLLTSDNTLWFWNVFEDVEEEEQRLSIHLPDSSKVASFAFGTGPGWEFFTVYITSSRGRIYLLCPVYPFGCLIPRQLLDNLHKEFEVGGSFQEKYPAQKLQFEDRSINSPITSMTTSTTAAKENIDSESFSMREGITMSESARQKRLFLEECLMAYEGNDMKYNDSSSYLPLGRTISRWEPSLQGPIHIEKEESRNSAFYQGGDYYIFFVQTSCTFPSLIHMSSRGYIRIYIQLGQIEPQFTNKETESESSLSDESLRFILFENIELSTRMTKESCCPILFRDFGESIWYHNKRLSNHLKETGAMFLVGMDSELYLLRIPWLYTTFEELNKGTQFTLSNIQMLAMNPNASQTEASSIRCRCIRGVAFFMETERLGIIVNFINNHMIWIPLVHFPHSRKPWDEWTSMASELDILLRQFDDEGAHSQRPLEKRCDELLNVIAKPLRYAGGKELNIDNVELEASLRFLQEAVSKYREEYISNFEKLSLILSDAMDKIPKGLERVERRLEKIQAMLKESQLTLENLENKLSLCRKISQSLVERAQIIREALIEGRGRLSKAEVAWSERIVAQWKDISRYQNRMKELKKSVENAFQDAGKKSSEKSSCFTKEELDSIYQSLNEHTAVLNKLFTMATKLEQGSSGKHRKKNR